MQRNIINLIDFVKEEEEEDDDDDQMNKMIEMHELNINHSASKDEPTFRGGKKGLKPHRAKFCFYLSWDFVGFLDLN